MNAKVTYDTIMAMRAVGGKLAKIALLKKQANNKFMKEYLRMMYEPRVNFWVKKINPKLATKKLSYKFDETALDVIKAVICNRTITGGKAREALANLHQSFSTQEEKDLLDLMIGRDAKSGFGLSTINKIWPNLITDVPYMRCCLPNNTKLDKFPWGTGVYSQLKLDGMFANVTHSKDGVVTIDSRGGSPFPIDMFSDLVKTVKKYIAVNRQLHGELIMIKDGKTLPRTLGNGMFNSIQQGGDLEKGCVPVYIAWDMIPADQARAKNKYKVAYKDRFGALIGSIEGLKQDILSPLQIVEYKIVKSLVEAKQHYKEMLLAGNEGTVIKHPDMIWEDTTSKFQVKMKLDAECDLKVVGFKPGNGKNEVLFGSIELESADGKLEVNVSGFTDKLRAQIWEDRDILMGKIMTVKSNCLLEPTKPGGKYSLFLPRYEETRLDKKTADTLEKIIEQFDAAINSVA